MPGDDRPTLTVDEAVAWLDPPMTRRQLADILQALKIPPAAKRRGPRGRPAHAYDAAEVFRLHAAIAPWLAGGRDL